MSKQNTAFGYTRKDKEKCMITKLPPLNIDVLRYALDYDIRPDPIEITASDAKSKSRAVPHCGSRYLDVGFIVNGKDAAEKAWPWQVFVTTMIDGKIFKFCGGTLINEDWVLTAAHCLGSSNFTIIVGETDLLQIEQTDFRYSSKVIQHEYFIYDETKDIGLIKLDSPVTFSSSVFPACLPTAAEGDFTENDGCYISGFGETKEVNLSDTITPMILQETKTRVLNTKECKSLMRHFFRQHTVSDSYICLQDTAGPSSSCNGDSGGPLSCLVDGTYYVAGVTSFGVKSCTPGSLNVYTRVSYFTDWILKTMKHND